MSANDFYAISPLGLLLVWAMVLLLVDLFIPDGHKGWTALLAGMGMVASLALTLTQINRPTAAFNGMLLVDGFAAFLNVLFLSSGLAGIGLAYDYLKRMGIERGEYYSLLMFTVGGMMLMAQAGDLIVVFLALELLSIPLYVMAGFARPRLDSEEASLKYFLLGSFASGFVLFGVAMIYGATGHTGLQEIIAVLHAGQSNFPVLFLIGSAMLLVGFGFKVAAVPFHMWTPDVYQGSPSPVSGFMSVGAKAAGFAALLRVFVLIFPSLATDLIPVTWLGAALTMIVGNILAISQSNIKRMLAYSSIAHAGYILMAFVPFGNPKFAPDAVASALFYLATYALTSIGAWAVVIAMEQSEGGKGLDLSDYAGLSRRYPVLSAAMAIFMLSFTGVPPLVGFWGKFYLFRTVIEAGFINLAVIGLITSIISAFYYLRVIYWMYMREGQPTARREGWLNLTVIVSAVVVLVISILPNTLFTLAAQANLIKFF
ncbi:MAG TPA: NADH-quinone oxidoreductase subunit N [Anaerolineaceae bacterium]|nr:NADH-quinone oxidoreductase subunit N [Anaerolineaceae bacterium]